MVASRDFLQKLIPRFYLGIYSTCTFFQTYKLLLTSQCINLIKNDVGFILKECNSNFIIHWATQLQEKMFFEYF